MWTTWKHLRKLLCVRALVSMGTKQGSSQGTCCHGCVQLLWTDPPWFIRIWLKHCSWGVEIFLEEQACCLVISHVMWTIMTSAWVEGQEEEKKNDGRIWGNVGTSEFRNNYMDLMRIKAAGMNPIRCLRERITGLQIASRFTITFDYCSPLWTQ